MLDEETYKGAFRKLGTRKIRDIIKKIRERNTPMQFCAYKALVYDMSIEQALYGNIFGEDKRGICRYSMRCEIGGIVCDRLRKCLL